MKVSEIKRMLRAAKCKKIAEGANHEIWFSPITGRKFAVPRHDAQELKTGTAEHIKKDAGLS